MDKQKAWEKTMQTMADNGAPLAVMGYCKIAFDAAISETAKQIKELEQNSCGDCTDGWRYNRVEVRHACTCMTEMEPFQILETALVKIATHTGEDCAYSVGYLQEVAKIALRQISPLDYAESV